MPKKPSPKRPSRPETEARAPLPSKADIVAYIAREREATGGKPFKIGKREVSRAFGIKGSDRIGLKALLKELEADGAVERRGKILNKKGALPNVVLADIDKRDRDGELLATPVEWAEDLGPPPKIIVHVPRKTRPGQPAPGVGDRALLRAELSEDSDGEKLVYVARVIKLLSRAKMQVLGIYRALPSGGGRLLPVDKKNMSRELVIPPGAEREAQDGDLVAVEIMREGRFGLPAARVKERLGSLKNEKAVSLIAIHAHNIPNVFRPETLTEAEAAKPATMEHREDWRPLPLITIDPADAKDHDDAVHAQRDDDPDNEGGYIVTVAIADVAAYVRPGRPLDREALERGNSVYFPDRVVPMLPERISNDLCSLRPLEDRPAMAVRMIIGANGQKKSHAFHRIMMRSAAKLSYQQAQAAIDGRTDDTTAPLMDDVLRPLWAAYETVKQARDKRSPLDLDLPERKILLKPDGTVDRVITPPRLDAHKLIEEFMILANVAAAETLERAQQELIYRAHDEPSAEKLNAFGEFLNSIGVKLAKGQVVRPENFNVILARVKGGEHEHAVNEIVLRTQAQAEYVAENYGHFGLNLKRYAHFTSPIRRYADLIVHRALIRALKLGKDGLPDMERGELAEIAARISAAERRAMVAERETVDRLIAGWLSEQIGASFKGRIGGVTKSGLFVKLLDTGADGFIPASTLGADYYRYEESAHALIGNRTGETFRIGDIVEVKLVEAAPFAGALRFEMLSDGVSRKTLGLSRGKGGRDTKSSRRNGPKPSSRGAKKKHRG